jgi:hypothetical protein
LSRKKDPGRLNPLLTGEEILWLKRFLCIKTIQGAS